MGLLRGKECMENYHFWNLEFGVGAKFGQKMKSICCVKVVENGAESLGAYKNTF